MSNDEIDEKPSTRAKSFTSIYADTGRDVAYFVSLNGICLVG